MRTPGEIPAVSGESPPEGFQGACSVAGTPCNKLVSVTPGRKEVQDHGLFSLFSHPQINSWQVLHGIEMLLKSCFECSINKGTGSRNVPASFLCSVHSTSLVITFFTWVSSLVLGGCVTALHWLQLCAMPCNKLQPWDFQSCKSYSTIGLAGRPDSIWLKRLNLRIFSPF